jgi:hypothetical protein
LKKKAKTFTKFLAIMKEFEPKRFKEPKVILSKGKSGAVISFKENLLIPDNVVFPPIEIASKLCKSEHLSHYSDENQKLLTKELGYYSDLQSIKSEDAITWSLFGYIAYQKSEIRLTFFNQLLEKLKLKSDISCEIKLWQRLPHPETFVSGGPEMDVILIGSYNLLLVECKWASGISKNQGKEKNKSQIEIRNEWKEKLGKPLFPNHEITILIVANESLSTDEHFIDWKEFTEFYSIPHKTLFTDYYQWKIEKLR